MINIENKEVIYNEVKKHSVYRKYEYKIKLDIESFILYLRKIKNEYRNVVYGNAYHSAIKIKYGRDYWVLAVQYEISSSNLTFTRASFYKLQNPSI